MTVLDCRVSSCVHNETGRCCRGSIEVKGQDATKSDSTFCGSYDKRGCGCTNRAKEPDDRIDIRCEAEKCTYNDNYNCTAGHVGVVGSNAGEMSQTECGTFTCNCR